MSKLVEVSDKGHVRTIRLNRPEKKNALSQQLAWGVVEAVDAAAVDDNVWVVALTGAGDAFCAGLDLSGSDPYSPYPEMTAQLDDIGWVGQFVLSNLSSSPLMTVADMALSLFAVNEGFLDDVPVDKVGAFEAGLHAYARQNHQALLDRINASGDYDDEIKAELKQAVEGFKTSGAY